MTPSLPNSLGGSWEIYGSQSLWLIGSPGLRQLFETRQQLDPPTLDSLWSTGFKLIIANYHNLITLVGKCTQEFEWLHCDSFLTLVIT